MTNDNGHSREIYIVMVKKHIQTNYFNGMFCINIKCTTLPTMQQCLIRTN